MKKYILVLATIIGVVSCQEERPELGTPPAQSEAEFDFSPDNVKPNIINFSSRASNGQVRWDLDNGAKVEGKNIQGIYPLKGAYTVQSTVYTNGGSASSSRVINIADDDYTLLDDTLINWLTGGFNDADGRTWVVDSVSSGHMGLGPVNLFWPEWWAAQPNDKSGVGLYNDRYTFTLDGLKFDMEVNGDVYLHNSYQNDFPGSYENKTDYTAPYTDQLNNSWTLSFLGVPDTILTITGGGWLGMYTGNRPYEILSMTRNSMYLRTIQDNNTGVAWYLRLVPEGVDNGGGGGGGPAGFALPFDFETIEPVFNGFGGSTVGVVNNPNPGGINTSSRVLETTHGFETWAGIEVNLDSKLDFTTDSLLKVKVYSTRATGDVMRVKIEDQTNNQVFIEKDVAIPAANQWVEVEVSFAEAQTGTFDKLVLFPGWNSSDQNTYQLDDIKQAQ